MTLVSHRNQPRLVATYEVASQPTPVLHLNDTLAAGNAGPLDDHEAGRSGDLPVTPGSGS